MPNTETLRDITNENFVISHVKDLGYLPESFRELGEPSGTNWVYGIGVTITESDIKTYDPFIDYFKSFDEVDSDFSVPVWRPEAMQTPQENAIGDIVGMIAKDYRISPVFEAYPNHPHRLYGEIRRSNRTPSPPGKNGVYDDSYPHLDFGDPSSPFRTYMFNSNNPAIYFEGEFLYRGALLPNYRDDEWRFSLSPVPKLRDSESGKLYVGADGRTMLHRSNITVAGDRTHGRMFAGPDLS